MPRLCVGLLACVAEGGNVPNICHGKLRVWFCRRHGAATVTSRVFEVAAPHPSVTVSVTM